MKSLPSFKPLLLALLLAGCAVAHGADHDHQPLAEDASLDYRQVLDKAVAHAPERLASTARADQAVAWQRLGDNWLPGRPRLVVDYLDDRTQDDMGMSELETRLEWQLWNWGGRRASRQLAADLDREYQAWQRAVTLAVAGKLRESVAALRMARLQVEQATAALDQAEQLLAIAEQRVAAGDAPRDAVLQARQLVLECRDQRLAAQTAQVDAERGYQFLTGDTVRPAADWQEAAPAAAELNPDHPLLDYLAARAAASRSQVATVRHDSQGAPTLSLGLRREQASRSEATSDSLSLGLSYPLGSGRLVSARVSDASRASADAEVELESARRQLLQQLHEVQHGLEVVEQRLPLAAEQLAISRQRADMTRQAFALGETTMAQVIQAWRLHQQQEASHRQLTAERLHLLAQLNQTLGFLP